jgi:hypothetical protein
LSISVAPVPEPNLGKSSQPAKTRTERHRRMPVDSPVFSPLHHRAVIDVADGRRLEAVGNIVDKDFEIRDGDQVVAQVSRAWFHVRDTYGVDVAPGEDDVLMICIAVCLDRIHHEEEEQRDR